MGRRGLCVRICPDCSSELITTVINDLRATYAGHFAKKL